LDVTVNSAGFATPIHVGAATDTPLIRYIYSDDGVSKMRTETDGVLSEAQLTAEVTAQAGG